ncbi:MAG TPA: phosphoribosylaminoimidazolesuccinocarboxamide synthase [Gemmatimonadetes bacterium]|nr:phosphoribosylaminoimidazolesuccinocarboxamide synthase [Gemmatimonadota bacterium]
MSESDPVAVITSQVPLPLLHQGKVRDVYDAGDNRLLMVASDRVSAFDVILTQPVPLKGEVLTQITAWWLDSLGDVIDHHLISCDPDEIAERVPSLRDSRQAWARRSMLVHRTEPVMVECVVRGYVSGSAWKEYRASGTLAGEPLPEGLVESQKLPAPIFSPSTKAQTGHDENISFSGVVEHLGQEQADRLRSLSFTVYGHGATVAEQHGIILADTKFEFGHDVDGRLLLIDEVLTPDSSRFWPADLYESGRGQPSLDKQPVRDFLDGLEDWDKSPPPPDLPEAVIRETTDRYLEIFRRLTGTELDDFQPPHFE